MAKVCPSCGTRNEDSAIFCDNCGSSFAAAGPAQAPAAPPYVPPPASAYPPPPVSPPPAAGGAVVCPVCGHPAMVGELFCDNCGASLAGAGQAPSAASFQPPPPMQPPFQQPAPQYQPPYQPPTPAPPAPQYQPSTMGGRFLVGGAQIPIPQKPVVTIGRPDQSASPPWLPDLDLTPYGGGEPASGVSRRHAKLTWQGVWYIEDLNSVNGVFVRGQKIFQRTPLNNGDQIALGRLLLTFYAG